MKKEALRFNEGKPMLSYFMRSFPKMVEAVARVKEMGAIKYDDGNWRFGNKPDDEYWNSMFRHLDYIFGGETYDRDTGCLHIAHAVWNLCALLELNYPDLPVIDEEVFRERAVYWAAEKKKREAEEERQRILNDPKWDKVPTFVAPRGGGIYVIPPKDESVSAETPSVFGSAHPVKMPVYHEDDCQYCNTGRGECICGTPRVDDETIDKWALEWLLAGSRPLDEYIDELEQRVKQQEDNNSPSELDIDPCTHPSYVAAGCCRCGEDGPCKFHIGVDVAADVKKHGEVIGETLKKEIEAGRVEPGVYIDCDKKEIFIDGVKVADVDSISFAPGKAYDSSGMYVTNDPDEPEPLFVRTHNDDGDILCPLCGSDVVEQYSIDGEWNECECGHCWGVLHDDRCDDCQDGSCPSGDSCIPAEFCTDDGPLEEAMVIAEWLIPTHPNKAFKLLGDNVVEPPFDLDKVPLECPKCESQTVGVDAHEGELCHLCIDCGEVFDYGSLMRQPIEWILNGTPAKNIPTIADLSDRVMRDMIAEGWDGTTPIEVVKDETGLHAIAEVMRLRDCPNRPVGEVMAELDQAVRNLPSDQSLGDCVAETMERLAQDEETSLEHPPILDEFGQLDIDEIMRRCAVDKVGNSLYRGDEE